MSRRLHPHRRKHAHAARQVLLELMTADDGLLVVEDPALANTLGASGWSRASRAGRRGAPWPTGAYTQACVRLLKSKPALELSLHGAASVLPAGATMWLYGANDEGIRSAPKRLGGLFTVEDATAKRHSRVFRTRRTDVAPQPLESWRASVPAPAGLEGRWVSYPGVFAKGGLDAGTAALLAAAPTPEAGARVLDFACGIGVVAGVLRARAPHARFTLLDNDALALRAAQSNVPDCEYVLSDGWTEAPTQRYDLILSNPPFHDGKDEDFAVLRALIAGAPRAMRAHATLWVVCQRQVPLGRLFEGSVLRATAVSTGPRFTVWKAHR